MNSDLVSCQLNISEKFIIFSALWNELKTKYFYPGKLFPTEQTFVFNFHLQFTKSFFIKSTQKSLKINKFSISSRNCCYITVTLGLQNIVIFISESHCLLLSQLNLYKIFICETSKRVWVEINNNQQWFSVIFSNYVFKKSVIRTVDQAWVLDHV